MIHKQLVLRLIFIPSALLMTACSPYLYKEEVGKFQVGVKNASLMLDSQKEFLLKRSLEINRSDLVESGSPRLVVTDGCAEAIICMETASFPPKRGEACVKELRGVTAGEFNTEDPYKIAYKAAVNSCEIATKEGIKVEIPTQLIAQNRVLTALSSYSNALAGIVDAQDRKALSESASKACSSTQQLYSVASSIEFSDNEKSKEDREKDSQSLEKKDKAITTVCGLVTEIGIAILDHQKLKVLTRVVNEGDAKVSLLAAYLASESRKVNSIVLRNELELLNETVGATVELKGQDKEYFAAIDSAVATKNKFMSALKASPEEVFLSMAEAHNKLKEAIKDPKTQLNAAIESIESFHKAAKEAHNAVKALSENDQ